MKSIKVNSKNFASSQFTSANFLIQLEIRSYFFFFINIIFYLRKDLKNKAPPSVVVCYILCASLTPVEIRCNVKTRQWLRNFSLTMRY